MSGFGYSSSDEPKGHHFVDCEDCNQAPQHDWDPKKRNKEVACNMEAADNMGFARFVELQMTRAASSA